MIGWKAAKLAAIAGAELLRDPVPRARSDQAGPSDVVIDSRNVRGGELFIGLKGERCDGGDHAREALERDAWGVLVAPAKAASALREASAGAVIAHPDPLRALQRLAGEWRTELGAKVVAITGSTGKTSTKDILAALLAPAAGSGLRTVASPENFNTEIGLPLAILHAPAGTQVLVLEMAMRGAGQIAELTAIARPDVGVIVNVGPVHLEQLGSLEAVATAKAELLSGLPTAATIVLPANEPLLDPYRREDLRTVTFGEGGDVELLGGGDPAEVVVRAHARTFRLQPSFSQAYHLRNLCAAVAVADALGARPRGPIEVGFSALRGEHVRLPGGVLLINDCYNANPMSMRAALDELAATARGRRVAVLGDMLELGPQEHALHRELGEFAAARGVELLVTVGPRARAMSDALDASTAIEVHAVADASEATALLPALLRDGDSVLVKGSRAMQLERIAEALGGERQQPPQPVGGRA